MNNNHSESAARWEKGLLGCFVLDPRLFSEIAVSTDDFLLDSNRKIYRAMLTLSSEGKTPDLISIADCLGAAVDVGYLASLEDGCVPQNANSYAAEIRNAASDRAFLRDQERLALANTVEERMELLTTMQERLQKRGGQDWRGIFHSYAELKNAPPMQFAINSFLQESGITLIGGLSGHGKTFIMLAMVKALLGGEPLFGHELFSVPQPAERVCYLIPESAISPFMSRIKLFGLEDYLRDDRLLIRTLQHPKQIAIGDPRLLEAAKGSHVFIDTLVRLMDGDENSAESTRPFADDLFKLIGAGARSIVGAHHSPKSFENADFMTLENVLRGSGDIGAALSTCWGVRQIDAESNSVYVQNVKPRDFQPCAPFILRGRPDLDDCGQFLMSHPPGTAGELRDHIHRRNGESGRPARDDKAEKLPQALKLRAEGKSENSIAKALSVPRTTLQKWIFDYDATQKPGTA